MNTLETGTEWRAARLAVINPKTIEAQLIRDVDKTLAEIEVLRKLLTSIKAHAAGALDDADDLPDGWTPDYELVLVRIIEKVDAAHAQ